jgi:hypothetical protein
LFAKGRSEPLWKEEATRQGAGPAQRGGGERTNPWVQAVKTGQQSPGSFLNAGPITDAVNLAAVALRAGKKVLFDSASMTITNAPEANQYLRREYRKGWEL